MCTLNIRKIVSSGLLLVLTGWVGLFAQTDGLQQINDEVHTFLLRQQTDGLLPKGFLDQLPLSVYDARTYLLMVDKKRDALSNKDRDALDRFLQREQLTHPRKYLFHNGADYWQSSDGGYALQINPYVNLFGGLALETASGAQDQTYINARGIRASGHIGDGLFFESRFSTNIVHPAEYEYFNGVSPRTAGVKGDDQTKVLDYYDFMGMVGYRSKYMEIRAGRDNNRWGAGVNSLILSNYGPAYDQVQIRTTVGPFQYVNLYGILNDRSYTSVVVPRKYVAMHKVSAKLSSRLEVGIWEAVVFAPDTVKSNRRGFDFSYLNPVVMYRATEYDRGSPDNALIGVTGNWQPIRKLTLFGQFLMDEFRLQEILPQIKHALGMELDAGEQWGWWANKWGMLAGLRTTLIPKTLLTMEYARIRPYMYSHWDPRIAYTQNAQLMGHQAGPNSVSWTLHSQTQVNQKLSGILSLTYRDRGRNTPTQNWGADPMASYDSYVQRYENVIGQGVAEKSWWIDADVSYAIWPQTYLDAGLRITSRNDAEKGKTQFMIPFFAVRSGMPFPSQRY